MIISQPDRILLARQVRALAPELFGVMLDVGSGDGARYQGFLPNVTKHIRMDFNDQFRPDIVGSAEKIPMADGSVDSVLCTQVLEHVPHPWVALAEISRVLRPGGKALLTAPQLNELHEEPHDYFRYTRFGLASLCEEAGLRVIRMDQRGRYRASIAQMRIRSWIDAFHPYQNRLAMLLLAPVSAWYARWALWCDDRDASDAASKHALGWAVLLEKTE